MYTKSFKLSLVALFVFITANLNAQINSFDLSTYINPVFKLQMLNFNFNLSGNGSNQQYSNANSPNYSSFYMTGNAGVTYELIKNNENFQGSDLLTLSTGGNKQNQTDGTNWLSKEEDYTSNLHYAGANRFYFAPKQFFEMDLQINANQYFYNNNFIDNNNTNFSNTTIYHQSNLNIDIPLLYGIGRVEQVQDARLAAYILDDLSKKGKFGKQITNSDILEFAKLISKLKNTRFFDSRIYYMQELAAVDSFLRTNDLLKDDIQSFGIINDDWGYGAGPSRASGSRFSFGIEPAFGFSHTDYYLPFVNNTIYEIYADLNYVYNRPINLYWQNDFNISTKFGLFKTSPKPIGDTQKGENLLISPGYALGWYPNTRTSIYFNVNGNYDRDFYTSTNGTYGNQNLSSYYLYGALGLTLQYYFSPQLQLNASYSFQYYFYKNGYQNDMYIFATNNFGNTNYNPGFQSKAYNTFNITLTYSLF